MISVEVNVNTDKGEMTIPLGKNYSISLGDKKCSVFVNTSQSSSGAGDDTPTGYILRAIIGAN